MFKKTILYLSLALVTGVVISTYLEPEPSGFVTRLEEGITLNDEFLYIIESYDIKSSPPYFFSTYRPEDELYEPVLAIQQERAYDAVDKLEELAAQDNADALYWLAEITYKSSAFSVQTGAELFKRSAELGNPYAALMLDDSNRECQKHMPSHCDKKWGELAKKLLIERENNGDLEASYTLIPDFDAATREDYEKLVKLSYQGFEQGYLIPLHHFIFLLKAYNFESTPDKEDSISIGEDNILNKLTLLMAYAHQRLAIYDVIQNERNNYNQQEITNVINHNLHTMGNSYKIILNYLGEKADSDRESQLLWASFAKVADMFQDNMRNHINFLHFNIGIKSHSNEFSDEELEIIDQLATENLKKATPNIFISMACPDGIGSCLRVNE